MDTANLISTKWQLFSVFPLPQTKSQLRSFLGLTGYYASHSYHLSEAKGSLPVTVLSEMITFMMMFVISSPVCVLPLVMCIPLPSDSFCLQTDASGLGIRRVLSVNRDGKDQPVAYYMTAPERNY